MSHSVITITLKNENMMGFLVENGNSPEAVSFYQQQIHRDEAIPDGEAEAYLTQAKEQMQAQGYVCRDIETHLRVEWLALISGRPLTDEEREEYEKAQSIAVEFDAQGEIGHAPD